MKSATTQYSVHLTPEERRALYEELRKFFYNTRSAKIPIEEYSLLFSLKSVLTTIGEEEIQEPIQLQQESSIKDPPINLTKADIDNLNLAATEFNRALKEFDNLFPPLELCQRAQKLGFPETRFRWTKKSPNAKWEIMINPDFLSPLENITNHKQKAVLVKFREEHTALAPTLQEVLKELPNYSSVEKMPSDYIVSAPPDRKDTPDYESANLYNPAQAALELWCKLEERKREQCLRL